MSRSLPEPPSSADTGDPDPRLTAALTAYAADHGRYPDVIATLQVSRLLVPVVAVLGEVEHDDQGRPHEKTSEMASVLSTGADGRLALLAFTGLAAMRAWDPDARPVPVPGRLAAQSALQDGAAALLLDLAGPVPLAVEGDDLRGLAHGWTLARVGDDVAWVRPTDSAGSGRFG